MIKEGAHTTMFEVSDNVNGKVDLTTGSYDRLFCEFLATLGLPDFEYKVGYNRCEVLIDGVNFSVETKNCTYWSRNAYTRKTEKRKDENRFALIGFWHDLTSGRYVAKVHVNKEIDSDKLKAKILKAVNEKKAQKTNIENQREIQRKLLDSVGIMFKASSEFVSKYVTGIHLHKGYITFIVNGIAHLKLDTSLLFVDFTIHCLSKNRLEYMETLENLKDLDTKIKAVLKEVQANHVLSEEQISAVKNAYETTIKLK